MLDTRTAIAKHTKSAAAVVAAVVALALALELIG